jgi:tRNA dimethylallyltransferase
VSANGPETSGPALERYLVGPTGVGKSAVAQALAERRPLALLSLDSMQVFRGMDVGTAKPTPAERARATHELLDLVDPRESFSVARWLAAAEEARVRARARGLKPLFVGGTALYLKALTHGLFEGPSSDPEVRERLQRRADAEGSHVLHAELLRCDPVAAARIHPNDVKRIVRALEVFELTGEPISELQREWSRRPGEGARIVGLTMPREQLDARIAARVREMIAAGWIDEVARLEAAGGLGPQASAAVGYAPIAAYLRGERPREGLEIEIATATRRFARRQMTWYRSFPQIQWVHIEPSSSVEELAAAVERRLELDRP